MRLQILLPQDVLVDERNVSKVAAEATHGSFVILPRHIDFVAAIVPGILLFERDGAESVVGVDDGILVKQGDRVRVSVRDGVRGPDLGRIRKIVTERFEERDEHEKRARTALSRLEASFYRRIIEQEHGRGG